MEHKRIVRVRIVISDYHLSEGAVFEDGRPNPREDFKDLAGYGRLLRSIRARYGDDVFIELEWNGDMLDFNPIRYRGSFKVEPTEEACLAELETCLRGNAGFFDATAEFLTRPRTGLKVRIGNHDQPLAWPSLQSRLRTRLLPEGPAHGIRFIIGEDLDGRVLTLHGDLFDPFNAIPSEKDMFITGKSDRGPLISSFLTMCVGGLVARGVYSGAKDLNAWRAFVVLAGVVASFVLLGALFRKIRFWRYGPDYRLLNMPYGTYLDSFLVATLKYWYPWYGRMAGVEHALSERISVLRNWRHIGLTVCFGLPHLIYHRFFRDLLSARHKAAIIRTFQMLVAMMGKTNIDRSIWRLVRKYPQADWVIMGHYHAATVWSLWRRILGVMRRVVLIDTGTGIEQIRMDLAEGGFFDRIVAYWRRQPKTAALRTLVHLALASAPFMVTVAGGWKQGTFEVIWASAVMGLLFFRKSLALEEKERFTRFTPAEVVTYEDGSQRVRLLRFDQHAPEGTDPFSTYLES